MARKISDIEEDSRCAIQEEVESLSNCYDDKISKVVNVNYIKNKYGICFDCRNFTCAQYEFTGEVAKCEYFGRWLIGKDRVTNCNCYYKRATLSLQEMQNIAYILEVDKNEVGFKID